MGEFVIISFSLSIDPQILSSVTPPDAINDSFAHKGVVLSGRGPVWLYGFLIHFYHPTRFVATYDPRLQGAVVVQSHDSKWKVGDVVSIDNNVIN